MTKLFKTLALRRFNFIDALYLVYCNLLLSDQQYVYAVIVFILGVALSAAIEVRAESTSPETTDANS